VTAAARIVEGMAAAHDQVEVRGSRLAHAAGVTRLHLP
jgi:hypothetical protein